MPNGEIAADLGQTVRIILIEKKNIVEPKTLHDRRSGPAHIISTARQVNEHSVSTFFVIAKVQFFLVYETIVGLERSRIS